MENKKKEIKKKDTKKRTNMTPTEVALQIVRETNETGMMTDPFGSWTGVPIERDSVPVQDADDL